MMAKDYIFGPGIAIGYGVTALAAILLLAGLLTATVWLWIVAIILFVAVGLWWGGLRRAIFPNEGRQRNC